MKLSSKIAAFALCAVCLLSTFATFSVAGAASESALKISGNTAWIGEYPQTICSDETTLTALASVSQSADGYYHYGGERYAKCVAKIHDEGGGLYSDGSTPISDETKYFKVEPIKWIVLSKEGNKYLLLSETILDTHAWQTQNTGNKITVDINGVATELPAYDWQYSEIREWLNGDFFNKAFNESAKKFVLTRTTPPDKTTSDVATVDYINILCNAEFEEHVSDIKDRDASDYSKAQELFYHFHEYKFSFYWLNSPPSNGDTGYVSTSRGYEISYDMPVDSAKIGIRPLISVNAEKADFVQVTEETTDVPTDEETTGVPTDEETTGKVLTDAEKEEKLYKNLKIGGVIFAVIGIVGVVLCIIFERRYCKKNGMDYKTHKLRKKFVAGFVPAFLFAAVGILMFVVPVAINSGFSGSGGLGGAAKPNGIYMEIDSKSGQGWTQVGLTAFKFDSNGTASFTAYYDGDNTNWQKGTWTQSGSTVTVTIPGPDDWGFTETFTINSSGDTLSHNGAAAYKKRT